MRHTTNVLSGGLGRLAITLKQLSLLLLALGFATATTRGADALNPGDLDPTFKIGNGGNSPILSLVINQTNGVMYIGGRFSRYNTNDVRRFAVLNPNGSLDLTWWNKIKNFNQPGANDNVNVVTLDNQGRVLVGGRFGTFFGRTIRNLVRLNPDGTLDETFNNGSDSTFGPNDEVTSIFVTPDDKVLIAGQFTSYNDGTQTLPRAQMARLNADMTIDTTFDPGLGAETTSGSPINTIVQQPDGKILIGGEFTRFQSSAVGRITRLTTTGALDPTFNPAGAGLGSGNIREIELLPDGRILAVGNIVSYNGTGTKHFIRLSSTGALDTSFAPQVSAQIRAVEVQADGKYLIVGDFRTVGSGNSARPSLARINADGTPDLVLDSGVGTARTPESPNTLDIVYSAKLDPDDFLVLVGDFTHWNTTEFVNRITRIATADVTVTNTVAPSITVQPQSQTVCVGTNVALSVTAAGTAPLTYQWSKGGAAIAGANAATYTIGSVAESDAGSYTVTIGNSIGSVTSSAATLTVQTPPAISTQPQPTAVDTGSGFTLSVTAGGTAPLTYQWKRNGVAIGGATAASYTVPSAAAGDAGSYTVDVGNACATVTSATATVTVNPPNTPPSIVTQPQPSSLVVCAGTNVSYSVAASGTSPLSYQWSLNGVAINGATSPTLLLASVSSANSGSYTVTIGNAFGNATSSAVSLSVQNPPTVTSQPQSTTIGVGNTLALTVGVSGTAPFTFQWFKNGAAIGGATAATYTVPSAAAADAGSYTVTVSNACGSTTSAAATVAVSTTQPPDIVGHPLPQQVKEGSSAFFNVVALGTSPFTYQWFKDSVAIGGATSQTLLLTGVSDANAGSYSVQVSNSAGSSASTNALLTVLKPPTIATQPQTQTVVQGNTLALSVAATGTAPLSYQWKLNGSDIIGANAATLSIPNVQTANAGSYTVSISNVCAVVSSQAATVTVGVPPTVNGGGQPQAQTVCTGTNVTLTVSASGTAPLTYQWSLNGVAIAGATAATLVLPAVTTANAGAYTVQISNAHGTVTSSGATLTVQTPPAIATQPVAQTVLQGNTLILTVGATGTAPFTYQWKRNGAAIAGANSATLSLPNIQENQAGTYTVDVSNACGTATSTGAAVTVGVPPVIAGGGQPQAQTVCVGTNVALTVVATGTAPLTYQWLLNSAPIAGATSATLLIPTVSTANAGAYTVQISNAHGTVTSSGATLTVQTPPAIVTQPVAQTVLQGNTLILTVGATGTAPFTYQWKRNGAAIAGATSATFSLPNIQENQAGTYTVDVSNACGTTTSTGAAVTVGVPPGIAGGGQPQAQTVCVGTNVALTVVATGTAPLTYQWLLNSAPIAGATSATLLIPTVSTANAGAYTVQISNAHGTVTSSGATLTVQTPPAITTQPVAQTVLQGNTLILAVGATGTAPFTYQWKRNGAAIAGANSATFSLPNIQENQAGTYTVDVSNACGTTTSTGAAVTVGVPPGIAGGGQPQPQTVCVGTNVALTVVGTGSSPLTYQWSLNGAPILGATSATLLIPAVSTANAGTYTVRIGNAHGTVTSSAATLTVQTPPAITTQPQTQTVVQGNTLVLSVAATGTAPLNYQWKLNGAPLAGANAASLSLGNIQAAQAGTYTVDVSNVCGTTVSSGAQVTVGIPPAISGHPQPQDVIQGTTAVFTVAHTGDGPCTYQWLKNGVTIPGATSQTLSIANAQDSDEGNFSVIITCAHGAATSNPASLTVRIPPFIITPPQSKSVNAGTSVIFTVSAGGDPTLTYQWFKNGATIGGATGTSLIVANAQDADEGSYTVRVTNPYGNATSVAATLTVNNPPAFTGQPQDREVVAGNTATFAPTFTGDGPCTFQWRRNGVNIAGATNLVLSVSNAQKADEAGYSVVITCPFGTVVSRTATLTVRQPPVVITNPIDQSVLAGSTVGFNVLGSGDPTLAYQWFRNGVAITGATNTSLILVNAQDADEATYSATVTNPYGNATSAGAVLTVNNPPGITDQPLPQTVLQGTPATFTITVSGDGPCTYQWRRNNVDIPGATSQVLTIGNSQPTDEALYSVVVTCPFGTVISTQAQLTVNEPPIVITNPADQSVIAGNTATFNVLASGDPTITYQWFKNGIAVAGATNVTLVIPNAQDANEGVYSAQAINPFGSASSAGATLTVHNPPVIVTPPQPLSVVLDTPATFTVTVGGDGPCTFQWLKNGVALPGATNQVLTIAQSRLSDAASYSARVDCPFGSVTSPPATLTVNRPPVIIIPPQSLSVVAGSVATFTVTADGDPTLVYQWKKNGVDIAGATGTILQVFNAQDADEGSYSVMVSNPYGSVTSTPGVLTVNNPPTITGQPQPQVVLEGTTATFTVGVTADGACSFQWRRNGVNLPGRTSQTLTIPNALNSDEADYSVVITCPFGSATSQGASLTVNRPPVIVTPPQSLTVISGTTASFAVVADGDPTLVYQWKKNGVNIPGANSLGYTIPAAQESDEGQYSVMVTNTFGMATSTAATLTVNKAPVITGQPQPQEVIEGNPATFSVTVDADGPCTFQWRFNGVNIQQTTVPTLTIPNALRTQEGDYSVVVTCPFGSATSRSARLTVRIPPVIVTHPQSQTIVEGAGALFTVVATGDPTLRYQWSHNGVAVPSQTNNFLLLNNVQAAQAGNYHVVVTNLYGTATSSNALLTVKRPPFVTTPPQPQAVVVGQPATFTVTHSGDGPCTYQWMKDGVAIPGATSITLTIPNSQVSDQGLYSIHIACAFGSVTSPAARLTVNEPPIIVVHPQSQSVVPGNSVAFTGAALGTPTLFYQWYKNGVLIPGATTTSLTLANVSSNDIAQYSFVVTNAFGSATSSNATLTLNNPPVIISQPQGLTRPVGSSATFTVGVTGDGPCTYQWRKGGVVIPGATNISHTIPAVVKTDEADYSVVVTCPFGTVTSDNAPLKVTEPPRIIFHPISEHVIRGTNAVISVLAEGTETLTYQWYYQQSATSTPSGTPLAGRTLPTLHIANVTTNTTGAYYCIVRNSLGSETSLMAQITVLDPGDLSSGNTGGGGISGTQRTLVAPQVAGGQVTLQFGTADGQPATTAAGIVVQGSSDLVSWSAVSASIAIVNGVYQVVLNDPGSLPHRFYRVIYP